MEVLFCALELKTLNLTRMQIPIKGVQFYCTNFRVTIQVLVLYTLH